MVRRGEVKATEHTHTLDSTLRIDMHERRGRRVPAQLAVQKQYQSPARPQIGGPKRVTAEDGGLQFQLQFQPSGFLIPLHCSPGQTENLRKGLGLGNF